MSNLIQASFVLMGAGMGVVFLSLAVFFLMIVVFERVFKNGNERAGEQSKE